MKTVAIIGGGFCGTLTAVNLARLSNQPLRIALINSKHPLGRGVAYSTKRVEHLLNVAARNMSAVPDHPDHFLDWLRTRVEYADFPEIQLRETFAPRRVYGDYLRSLLFHYLKPIDEHHPAKVELIEGEAVDIDPMGSEGAEVSIEDGRSIDAYRVLLATGNQPPATLKKDGEPFSHPAFVDDPWTNWEPQIPDSDSEIVVLGTGLTMVDVFLQLEKLQWPGKIIAISRHGMIPQAHFRGIEYPDFIPADTESLGLHAWREIVEKHCEQLRQIGENPGIIVDRLRPHTQRIWQRLSLPEKREFLSKYAAQWNVIRHRIPQPIHQSLTEAITTGRLKIVRGSIDGVIDRQNRLAVQVSDLEGNERTVEGGLVMNCTGPNAGFSDTKVPLFQNLLQRGLIRADELDMGIDVGPDFRVTNREGLNSDFLFAVGPLMKGTLWETTAVPELRGQTLRVANVMLEGVAVETGEDYRLSVEEEHVIEYYI